MSSYHYDEGRNRGENGDDDPFGVVDVFIHALTQCEKREWLQGWRDGLKAYRHEQRMQAAEAHDEASDESEDSSDSIDDTDDYDTSDDMSGTITIPEQEYAELKKIEAKVRQKEQQLAQKAKASTDEIWGIVRPIVAEIVDLDTPFELYHPEQYKNPKLKLIREHVSYVSIKCRSFMNNSLGEHFWKELPEGWPRTWSENTDLKFYCEKVFYDRFEPIYRVRREKEQAQQEASEIELRRKRNDARRSYTILKTQFEWTSGFELCFTVDELLKFLRKRYENLISTHDYSLKDKVARHLCCSLPVRYERPDIYIAKPPSKSAIFWANRGFLKESEWKVMILRPKTPSD